MALKTLILRKKIDERTKALELLREKDADFTKREEELEAAVEEVNSDDPDFAEAEAAVEEEAAKFEEEKAEHEDAKARLEEEIRELESQLDEAEKEQDTEPVQEVSQEREETRIMETRTFKGVNEELVRREEVQAYLMDVRTAMKEKRALTNVGLTIPEVMLGVLRENVINYSKLYRHLNVRTINGEGRMIVMGAIPEAVWTDCCANLNELNLSFADVEVDCWKLGGFFAVCNANLEDSDINLATEILTAIGQAIGYALDKAVLYGTGLRMPLGVMTRLAQTSEPADYPATARPWEDLHTSNILSIASGTTGAELIAAIVGDSGAAKGKYSRGEKVWVMNETTYTKIVSAMVTINAAGAVVSGIGGSMPVVGGIIEVLDFVPDNVIIGGYFDLYLLAQRAGQKFATSEHYRFLQDQTVFKGTARYDGLPVIAEGFVAIGLEGTTPTAEMTFAPDEANPDVSA